MLGQKVRPLALHAFSLERFAWQVSLQQFCPALGQFNGDPACQVNQKECSILEILQQHLGIVRSGIHLLFVEDVSISQVCYGGEPVYHPDCPLSIS